MGGGIGESTPPSPDQQKNVKFWREIKKMKNLECIQDKFLVAPLFIVISYILIL